MRALSGMIEDVIGTKTASPGLSHVSVGVSSVSQIALVEDSQQIAHKQDHQYRA
jgi:hypothetical protein